MSIALASPCTANAIPQTAGAFYGTPALLPTGALNAASQTSAPPTSAGGGGILSTVAKLVGKSGIGDAVTGAMGLASPKPVSTAQRVAETAEIKQLTTHRTPALDAKAEALDKDGQWQLWQDMAKQYRQTHPGIQGWVGTAKMEAAIAAAGAGVLSEKGKYDLPRPFQIDPSIQVLGAKPSDASFPSGHSAVSWAAATVLGNLDPANRAKYENAAREVEWARMYSGVHLPSDVAAGEQIGRSAGAKFS